MQINYWLMPPAAILPSSLLILASDMMRFSREPQAEVFMLVIRRGAKEWNRRTNSLIRPS